MSTIDRRVFIEGAVATAVGIAVKPLPKAFADTSHDIIDVAGSDPKAMVKAVFDAAGGARRVVHKGDHVVLKPNAAFANPPAWATTTHPDTVAAVAQLCVEAGAKRVTVVEFPGGGRKHCLERCGVAKALANIANVEIKVLSEAGDFKTTQVRGGKALETTDVAKVILSADVFINIPAAKVHRVTGVTLGLKNAMGLIYDRRSLHTRFDLHQGIADLARVIKPDFTIVDATRALLTNGPAGPGETSTPGRMVAGRNVVSVDAYTLTVARFGQRQMTPADARHIALAAADGLGEADIAKLRVKKVQA